MKKGIIFFVCVAIFTVSTAWARTLPVYDSVAYCERLKQSAQKLSEKHAEISAEHAEYIYGNCLEEEAASKKKAEAFTGSQETFELCKEMIRSTRGAYILFEACLKAM